MVDRSTILPVFPRSPNIVTKGYMDDIVRSLNQLMLILKNPGAGRNTTLVLTDLPISPLGLETGSLYREGSVIRIVLDFEAKPFGVSASGSVGTVSVTTV